MGRPMCTDCGSTPAHVDSPQGYCRYCAEKGGHSYLFNKVIDVDKLRSLVGETLAREIIMKCENLYYY